MITDLVKARNRLRELKKYREQYLKASAETRQELHDIIDRNQNGGDGSFTAETFREVRNAAIDAGVEGLGAKLYPGSDD